MPHAYRIQSNGINNMIVPRYWAEARARERSSGRQVTVRRFGWSNASEAEAQANAEARAAEALRRIMAGEKLARRDLKQPYNGAQGLPIREEIVSEHEATVITRNSYGARCLNTPDVMFVDIDFETAPSGGYVLLTMAPLILIAFAIGWARSSGWAFLGMMVITFLISTSVATWVWRACTHLRGGLEKQARKRVEGYLRTHPEAHLRLYRTPAGLRVLAMHKTFDPREPAVAECFKALGTDPIYALMCANQNCFRARVSAKPWRIGVREPLRPRPGVWPIKPERLPARKHWVDTYEKAAQRYAACRFIEALGSSTHTVATHSVQALHDEMCRATSDLPIA